jgi:hypothetical protein
MYEALRASDRTAYRRLCAPDVEWRFMRGFPHGGTRVGHAAVFEGVFPRLMRDFDRWTLEVDEILRDGAAVVGIGRYRGRARETGTRFAAEFVHVFHVRRGRIARVRQFTDTAVIARALGGPRRPAPSRRSARRPSGSARRRARSGG